MPDEKKSILQPKNDVVCTIFQRKTKDNTSDARGYTKDKNRQA